jgi:hypothetical protein
MIEQRHVEEFPTSGVEYLGRERKDKYGRKKRQMLEGQVAVGRIYANPSEFR